MPLLDRLFALAAACARDQPRNLLIVLEPGIRDCVEIRSFIARPSVALTASGASMAAGNSASRREIEARHEEADRLHLRAIERAQIEADLAQRHYMLVDPNNRLVADALEGEWSDRLRALAKAQEEREHARK
jgi:hypothetical protein